MSDRSKIRNIICVILSILLAGGLGYLYYTNRQQEKDQAAVIEALREEAKEYENELQELRSELGFLQSNVSYSSEEAEIMVGFAISDVSDLSYIKEKAETYGFSPVLVIDCTMDLTVIEEMMGEAAAVLGSDWEIMLYATAYPEDVYDDIIEALSCLEEAGLEQTGVFLLRDAYRTTTGMQLLMEDGFTGYTVYNDESPTVGQTEDGIIYFDYHYLSTGDTDISERLTWLYSSKASMIVVFDMASVRSGALSEAYVASLLNAMQDYADRDDCSFSTVADVVEELSGINEIEAANQAEYEREAAELQERIDRLEETIDAIYDRLEY